MERKTLYADVILPLSLPGMFTYRVPYDLNEAVMVGQRVIVQFGKRKNYTALIRRIHEEPPQKYEVKYILAILDEFPAVNDFQFKLWDWIASYYCCYPGDVMNVAIPSALKLSSETKIMIHPDFHYDFSVLDEKEYLVAEALGIKASLTIHEVSGILNIKKVFPIIKNMIEKKIIIVEEEIQQGYKPKKETYIRLSEDFKIEENLKALFDKLEKKAPKQLEVLMAYISINPNFSTDCKDVKRNTILNRIENANAAIRQLVKKNVIEIYEKEVSRLENGELQTTGKKFIFSENQEQAYREIRTSFSDKDVVLLYGVTSSGKTEIYIQLIEDFIAEGKQVLYLLPEIALTTQIINRLRRNFPGQVGVYHSRFGDNEKVELWNSLISKTKNPFKIIVGARSALFLPFSNLGLVITDEEHDTSYKQNEPPPRYNARDTGIMLAKLHGAKTILGSATPSFESYYNAKSNKYGLTELLHRYGGLLMPEICIVDIREQLKKKLMKSHFTSVLADNIEMALKNKEQVILFQNRRGFSTFLECSTCNWIPMCKHCDVTLTYHKSTNQLSCHYCGYAIGIPKECPVCSSVSIVTRGFGTEKIEDELPLFFPDARIARMDIDSTKRKNAYYQILNAFEEREIDILVGTQMVTKGLDFENVSIVGILNADNMLSFPDFRTLERSFQLMSQVGGRAGRKSKQGKVIIQTYQPRHPVFNYILRNDYPAFYHIQLLEREKFKYPPFYRLIEISLRHKNIDILHNSSEEITAVLKKIFGNRILGPFHPMVSKIRNEFIKNILLKFEKDISIQKVKELIIEKLNSFKTLEGKKSIIIHINVDPL